MDEYTRLKEILESYYEMPDIELTEEQISVYGLYKIVDAKLDELRKINFEQKIIKDINKGLTLRCIGHSLTRENGISNLRCKSVTPQCDGKKSSINFHFISTKHPGDMWQSKSLYICKEVGSDEIYFGSNLIDKNFVAKHFDQISEIFSVLEEFSELYQGGVGCCGKDSKQVFSDGFFAITFGYDTYGRTNISIGLKKEADPENIYYRDWFQRQKLSDYVKENSETILRKIPVDISALNYTMCTIIKDYTSKMNVPVLTKKK